jgi:phospholipid/cholesterol/gamma-HCH transport system substrate-binding protein
VASQPGARPDPEPQEEAGGRFARLAALGAVLVGVAVVGLILFGGAPSYKVKAHFINAGQLVKGNLVEIGGTQAGVVSDFEITEDGEVEVEMEIDDRYAPLREGVRAVIRQGSQSSTANRYIELHLPSEDGTGDEIPDGGVIGVDRTTSTVGLDQFFNIFDRRTRRSLRGFFEGGYRQYAGRGDEANRGFVYLNPSLSQSARLFQELTYDPPVLERFLVDSSRLVTALAERRDDLSALIEHLNRTTRALGSQKQALADLISLFPGFMRTANTTYVNLRATLDDLDPLVEASKPVARKLGPVLDELRPFAREARPTVRNLAELTRAEGPDNDLVELNRTYPPLADIAVDTMPRTVNFGAEDHDIPARRGSFPEAAQAFRDSAPLIAHGRPYTPDFVGWFDDFSQTGAYDALGSFSRSQQYFNAFTISPTTGLPIGPEFSPEQEATKFLELAKLEQYKRCPGASEEPAPDNSNLFTPAERQELDCEESHRATGPIP